jgi:hypothetical protein
MARAAVDSPDKGSAGVDRVDRVRRGAAYEIAAYIRRARRAEPSGIVEARDQQGTILRGGAAGVSSRQEAPVRPLQRRVTCQ